MDATNSFPHIYVINLEASQHRRDSIQKAMPAGLAYSFYKAVEGKKFPDGCQIGNLALRRLRGATDDLSDGEFGCLASHLGLMAHLVDSGQEHIIVLEDDVVIPKNFDWALARTLEKAPADFDMIYLSYNTDMHINVNWPGLGSLNLIHDHKEVPSDSVVGVEPILLGLNRVWGLPAYVISKKGACKILESFAQPKDYCQFQIPNGYGGGTSIKVANSNPIDLHVLSKIHQLKALISWPMIAYPNMDPSTSIIGSDRSYQA